VIYARNGNKITIGDPGSGIIELSIDDFMDGFENAVLLLKPGPEFFKIDISQRGSSHYFQLLKGYGREALLVILCSCLLTVFSLFPPILSQLILDEVLSKKDTKLLFVVLGAGIVVAVSRGFLSWIRAYYLAYITTKFDFKASTGFIRKMFSLPYSFFSTRHVGVFTRRLSEMERVRTFFTNTLITVAVDLATLVFYAIILFYYSPKIAIATFCLAPVLVGISMFFGKRLRKAYSQSFLVRTEVESLLTDQIKGIGTIKTMGAELPARWRYEEKLVNALKADYSFSLNSQALNATAETYNQIARFLLMGYSAYLGITGELSPGQVVALSMIVSSVIDPFNSLAHAWSGVQEIRIILDRLNDIFLAPSEAADKQKKLTKEKLSGEVEFRDVWFRYGGDSSDWVLQGLSFKIQAGQNVAIVGESGSGKSTIAYLLSRMYEPQKGQILIDGRDIRDYDLQWLRTQVGLLHQESNLFHGSVAENIAFGKPRFESYAVENAAKMADASDFIEKKPNGYAYQISHGGIGLSGGEKQRISLARTIFTGASLLVLDEATSALDGISEKKLLESIKNNFHGMTILSIAHRYTTVKMSDFALVIAKGRCMGFGTHEHLSRDSLVYARLFGFPDPKEANTHDLAS
jgi:subfamily B ATP-binding cassette protein HlyB/CyaB